MIRLGRIFSLLALLLGAIASTPSPGAAMSRAADAPSIITSFEAFWPTAQGKPFAEQEALWNRLIEGPRESLYRAVVWEVRDTPGNSDGQYLSLQSKKMVELPRSRLPAAARDFLRVASTMTIDPAVHGISRPYAQWFEGSHKPLNPGYPNRAGYWLGLNLIRQLRRAYSLQQLASWTPAEAQQKTQTALVKMAANGNRPART